jgi:hypothetical protein
LKNLSSVLKHRFHRSLVSRRLLGTPPLNQNRSTIEIPKGTTINATTNAPDSVAVGINSGTINPPVDPNKPVITYDFDGLRRTRTPQGVSINQSEEVFFNQMAENATSKNWNAVLTISESEKSKIPAWSTPYFFSGLARANLCQKDKAISDFDYFIKRAPAEDETYKHQIEEARKDLSTVKSGMLPCP